MKEELDEQTRVVILKLIASGDLCVTGSFLLVASSDVAVYTLGLLTYLSSVGLFFSIDGKRKALKEYRKFMKL